jgi:hypothetical protein
MKSPNKDIVPIGYTIQLNSFAGKPVKMKLVSIEFLEKEKRYSYKFQNGNKSQYFLDYILEERIKP